MSAIVCEFGRVCVYVFVCMCVCVLVWANVDYMKHEVLERDLEEEIHTPIKDGSVHVYTNTYKYTYTHIYIYMHTKIHIYVYMNK